ncbi:MULTISPECIES: hypothetical protein [unclassified Jeotgalibaca]|uniref:hypothetical protein n=1 Tax=unclassified Jeotgalibaca TaxID=2621505 RepID=UPI003FD6204D
MNVHFLSKSTVGKWATGLMAAFVVLLALKMTSIGRLPLPTLVIAVIGIIGFILGVVAFLKYKDRAIMTIITLVLGLLLTIWVLAEIMFPH